MGELSERVAELLHGRTDRRDERAVLRLLAGCPAAELNRLLAEVDPVALFGSVDDRLFGPDLRSELVHLLAVERRAELDLPGRAQVALGLQLLGADPKRDEALAALLLEVRGIELTRLKNLLNTHSAHDLEDLVYARLAAEQVRQRVLDHLATEAAGLSIGEPKILSDIDDTALCVLHDRRYPRGIVYPGVLALYGALDQGPDDAPFDTGDLTFVTARPRDAFGLIESRSRDALRRAGVSRLSLMSGTLRHLHSRAAMARRKLDNVRHYRRLFGEYQLMFIGDSGQGDVRVGEGLYAEHGEVVRLVLIHDVVGTAPTEREAYARQGIWFFDTYVGAALVAHEHGLISAAGLDAVVVEAVREFERLEWDSAAQRAGMRALFERDLLRLPDRPGAAASGQTPPTGTSRHRST
ncbi:hypothetical protein CGZ93_06800 [Enemella dayhoffiae]|uniref:Phosphatidate phosphatase APP1 catalytic domain-containing protein n=1 Tax=Enemella dayhoffiae TaxID=2016507 RepID=A0A255H740_9ACTN|nr:phosphatase domain-containing protein [Enemella dayhoffiae]OYO23156.1 hypothetical protein CGZ93_06800 [Enemella dayhoffiae]